MCACVRVCVFPSVCTRAFKWLCVFMRHVFLLCIKSALALYPHPFSPSPPLPSFTSGNKNNGVINILLYSPLFFFSFPPKSARK